MLYWFFFDFLSGASPHHYLIVGWTYGYGSTIFLGELLILLFGYCLGRADYSPRLKASLWLAVAAFFSYRLYDLITVGLRSDADIFKPFFVWQLFLLVLLIPIGALVCHKKH